MPQQFPQSNCLELQNQYRELQELKTEFDRELERALLSKKLDKAQALKIKLQQAAQELKSKLSATRISAVYKDGETGQETLINFELNEQLEYWRKFYQKHNIDWCELPEKLTVAPKQAAELQRLIENYGFDYMMIIPEGLANDERHYEKFCEAMSMGIKRKYEFGQGYGLFELHKIQPGLRIIVTARISELEENMLFDKTKDVSLTTLWADNGFIATTGLKGLDVVAQMAEFAAYYDENGELPDNTFWSWLPGADGPVSIVVPYVDWSFDDNSLDLFANFDIDKSGRGCRLAGIVELKREE